jgi:hypothetical protein
VTVVLIVAAAAVLIVAAFAAVMWWEDRADDGRHKPAPLANYTLPAARETRAGRHALAGLPGAMTDDEWLDAIRDIRREDAGAGFLAAPTVVPGRDSPPPSPGGREERAPAARTPAAKAHPAGDPSHRETRALDYAPAVPFAFWLNDVFVQQQTGWGA